MDLKTYLQSVCILEGIRYETRTLQEKMKKIPQKNSFLRRCMRENNLLLKQTEDLLTRYYDLYRVPEQYRELVPMSKFYDYLNTGVCDRLEGELGAYRCYEQEPLPNGEEEESPLMQKALQLGAKRGSTFYALLLQDCVSPEGVKGMVGEMYHYFGSLALKQRGLEQQYWEYVQKPPEECPM